MRTRIRVRMGLHTGSPRLTEEGYVGMDVHRGARIGAAAHGGQIVLSRPVKERLTTTVELRDLGEHRLKDLAAPEWLFQPLAPGLAAEFPPLKTLTASNLPRPTRRLIGRERELAALLAALAENRLVTVTGSGGSGKTRLAIAAATELVDGYADGVYFVGLAALDSAELVAPAIAAALGVRAAPGQGLDEALARAPARPPDAAGAGQLRARRRGGGAGGGAAEPRPRSPCWPPAASRCGCQPSTSCRCWPLPDARRRAVRAIAPAAGVTARRPGRGRDLPAAGRAAAGDRAGRGARPLLPPEALLRAAGRRRCRC